MKVLHIEDSESISKIIQYVYQDVIEVEVATTLASAKERLGHGGIDVLLVDLGLPDSHGIDTVRALLPYDLPMVILSADSTQKFVEEALSLGVSDYIDKKRINKVDIAQKLKFAHEKSAKIKSMARRKLSFGNIEGLKRYISYSPFHEVVRVG